MKTLTLCVGLLVVLTSTSQLRAAPKLATSALHGGGNSTKEQMAPFRIPMKLNMAYSDPNPPAPFGIWEDVFHWQNFLYSHHFRTNTTISGKFNKDTKTDTANFQAKVGLNATGIVDKDTYCAARNFPTDPLRDYPPTPLFTCPAAHKSHRSKS